jgi:hypothetical protein
MSAPIVFLLDVLPADAVVDEATLEASITSGGDGSDVLSVFDLGPARGDGIFETIGVVGRHAQSVAVRHRARDRSASGSRAERRASGPDAGER